ncbi:MAG: TonB-dependent receptor [Ignavibacteriales bacterium]|nr:TonB-dependent receptor [Ignavibacteriales bacterium]
MRSSVQNFRVLKLFLYLVFLFPIITYAGTTGKLSGKILDENKEPVVGANIIIEGTYLGAAADIDGYYYINNIPPGEYRAIVTAVGFQKTIVENVVIKIDLTTKLDVSLNSTSVTMKQEVIVRAERPLVQKDLTSTSVTISASDIKMMPVESVGQIVNLQAGVMDGHFRGGRSNEVSYLVDGVSVTDAFDNSFVLQVENSSIRQMEVISGTFNAEYGQAMSGIVNIVTQDGSQKFEGSVNGYVGNYVTSHTDLFQNLDKVARVPTKNLQFSFSGPVQPVSNLFFFLTGRYYENEGYLYGKRVYNITDIAPIQLPNNEYIPIATGDGKYVSMNPDKKLSFNGKLSYALPSLKLSYSIFWDNNYNKGYDHYYSWTPDGKMAHHRTDLIHNFQISFFPSQSTFQTLKFSSALYKYWGNRYDDPYDPRYVDPRQGLALSGYTFRSGGNEGNRYERNTSTNIIQWALSSQISKEHKIGIGAEYRAHKIFNHSNDLINVGIADTNGYVAFKPGYPNLGTITDVGSNILYVRKPNEFSAYVQDKMEYDIMIINAGVRLDYFDPSAQVPVDLKNVDRNTNFYGTDAGGNLIMKEATKKWQVSPRLGASFPITDQGIIRFSYGHFFQIPSFDNLYTNPDYFVPQGQDQLSSIIGNPDLKPQKTVQYEIGLQQVLFQNLALDVTMYYRDIRNLLGMEIIRTYDAVRYARYINRDYGNVRGFIVTVDKRFSDYFGFKLDYTFQIAEGNSSDPNTVFNNNQTDPPIEETKVVVPLNWDQRNTLNASVTVGEPGDWTIGLIFQYGSGTPYTEDVRISKGVRFENGGTRPEFYNLDLRAEKVFKIAGIDINTFLLVYNILDIKNEYGVYGTTGRANSDLGYRFSPVNVIGLNTIEQYVKDPSFYSTPREIRVGFGFGF